MLRSLVFTALFYLSNALQMIVWAPVVFLGPRALAWRIVRFWARSHLWLLKIIVGTDHVVKGREKLPEGGFIIAPKHQAAWDTFAFLPWWPEPTYILKRELTWIPLFGWYLARMGMIAIDRGNREQAIRSVNAGARKAIADGRQIVIYPEGTRRPPGAKPVYKSGISHIYETLDVPVVPIAHNAGLYWPRHGFMRYPGTIEVEVLDPIPPGLPRAQFMAELVGRTEAANDRLLQRAAAAPDAPPLPDSAKARLAELAQANVTPTEP